MRYFNLKHDHKRRAFSMLELVFVIVVLGILASMAMSRLDRDLKQEAADTILSNIRYTQHLALMDNKHTFNDPKWQQRFWKIMFSTCSNGDHFYRIGSDDDMNSGGTFTKSEAATDPLNGKAIYLADNGNCSDATVSNEIFIGKRFGVTVGDGTGGCNGIKHIGFDHLGRPHVSFGDSSTPDYSSYMSQDCIFTFTMSDGDTFDISIAKETGYAYIVEQEDS
jgi:prepilin-type N-terminal cleavage/methylation domain-containing protein